MSLNPARILLINQSKHSPVCSAKLIATDSAKTTNTTGASFLKIEAIF